MADIAAAEVAAKVSEQAERYKDMVKHVKDMTAAAKAAGAELTTEQRNLLSVAYKNVVGACRAAFRALNAGVSEKQLAAPIADGYREFFVEAELRSVCNDLIQLVDGILETTKDKAGTLFFLKMKGDYYRYLAEVGESDGAKGKASTAYKAATELAESKEGLPATNPIRLGMALNYSVFLYEIMEQPKEATNLAKSAFDAAIAELDKLGEEQYKDATLIMQLIRDNLTLWSSDQMNE